MRPSICIAVLFAVSGEYANAGLIHCESLEHAFDHEITCVYMGPKNEEWKSVLITPTRRISKQKALDQLLSAVGSLEAGGRPPESMSFETDPQHSGEYLAVKGQPIRVPNTKNPAADFKKIVSICKLIDWEQKCKPFQ